MEFETMIPVECMVELKEEIGRLNLPNSTAEDTKHGFVVCIGYKETESPEGATARSIKSYYFVEKEEDAAIFALVHCKALREKANEFIKDARQSDKFLAITISFVISQVPVWECNHTLSDKRWGNAEVAFSEEEENVYFLFSQFANQIIEVAEKIYCTDTSFTVPWYEGEI